MKLFCDDPRGADYLARLLESRTPAERLYLGNVARFASRAHLSDVDDDGSPYIIHPMRVALILAEEAGCREPDILAVALLHDARERHRDLTFTEVAAVAGNRVAATADALAFEHRRNPGLPAGVGRVRYLQTLARSGRPALLVKMADRLDNLRESVRLGNKKTLAKRIRQEREDYAPLFASVTGADAAALRRRIGYFLTAEQF